MEYITGEIVPKDAMSNTGMYVHNLRLDRGFRLAGYEIREDLKFVDMVHDFLAQRKAIDGKKLVGATVHNEFDELPELWPDARYIYLNRDPRDIARSCIQMGWAGTTWRGADFWLRANECWQRIAARVPEDARMSLTFEELVAEPEANLKRICDFLQIEYEPGMLDIHVDTTYSRPDPASARSWRDNATDADIAQVEARVGLQRLTENGYPASGLPQIPDTAAFRLRIAAADLLNRVGARIKRYGFWLWVQGVITRRMPFREVRESVQLRIDHIDNLHMK